MEALRAAFDAVEKASKQLDEVEEFLNEKDWNGIHGFTRLFNNAVEREGMEPIARRLGKKEKAESLQVCSQLTQALKEMDRNATREDEEGILRNLQSARDIIASFQKFKP